MNPEDAFEDFCLQVLELLPAGCNFTFADARRWLPPFFNLRRHGWSPARVAAHLAARLKT